MLRFVLISAGLAQAIPESCADSEVQKPQLVESDTDVLDAQDSLPVSQFHAWKTLAHCLSNFLPYIFPNITVKDPVLLKTGFIATSCPNLDEAKIQKVLNNSQIMTLPVSELNAVLLDPTVEQWGQFWEHGDMIPPSSFAKNPPAGIPWQDRHIPYCLSNGLGLFAQWLVTNAVATINGHTVVNLILVQCNAPGHKIRFRSQLGVRPTSQIGFDGPPPQANQLNIPDGTVSTTQQITVNVLPFALSVVYQHEIIHALGFGHTQQRSDMETCIDTRNYDEHDATNCQYIPGPPGPVNPGIYDYNSIMHYPNLPYVNTCGQIAQIDPPNPNRCHGNFGTLNLNFHLSEQDPLYISDRYPNPHNPNLFN